MKKLFAILIVILLMLVAAVGCQPAEDQQKDQNNEIIDEEDAKPDEDGDINDENAGDNEGNLGNDIALVDGTYNAESGPDDRGYSAAINITVENGKISTVEYDEANAEGVSKTEDEEYSQNMKEKSGVSPAEAYEQLEEQLIETQNVDEVDVVTGATSSTEKFKELVNEALPLE